MVEGRIGAPAPVPGSDWSPGERAALDAQAKLPLVAPAVAGVEPFAAAPHGTTVESLLKPTVDKAGDPYVSFGSLRVARDLVDDFKTAQRYLSKDPESVDVLYNLEHQKSDIKLDKISDGNDNFRASNNTIQWDPKSALLNLDGSKQTPALGLLHEQGHALEFHRDPKRFAANVSQGTQRYDTAEEQRNITGLEDRAIKHLPGEGKRADHGGLAYDTTGPAQTAPLPNTTTRDADALRAAIHGERFALAAHGYAPPPPVADGADAVVPWNHKATTGSIVHIDEHTVAQHIGRGKYMTFDVQKDLHGVVPPEHDPSVRIDQTGVVHEDRVHTHVRDTAGR